MVISVSKQFKRRAIFSIISLLAFLLFFLILIAASVFLVINIYMYSIVLFFEYPHFITVIVAVAGICLGTLIIIYLFKFIFAQKQEELQDNIALSPKDEPLLFKTINEIASNVSTKKPYRVFVVPDVNASVNFDNKFSNLFFASKKNLNIGLGLINGISELELKAILAHEFGHFSQRSMRISQYVYKSKRIIYNLLFENKSVDDFANAAAQLHWIVALGLYIGIGYIKIIQWILKAFFIQIANHSAALSREMEFHADAVAANLYGHKPLANSLLRLPIIEDTFQLCINFYNEQRDVRYKSTNIYADQQIVQDYYSKNNQFPLINNYPQISLSDYNKYNKSNIIIKDQWASHPTTEDRIAELEKSTKVQLNDDYKPAASLFLNISQLQERMTQLLFEKIQDNNKLQVISSSEFKQIFTKEIEHKLFPSIFNGYFDNYTFFHQSIPNSDQNSVPHNKDFFTDINSEKVFLYNGVLVDLEKINMIKESKEIGSFDYMGIKYKRNQAADVEELLKREQQKLEKILVDNEAVFLNYYLNKSFTKTVFLNLYTQCISAQELNKNGINTINKIHTLLHALTDEKNTEIIANSMESIKKESNNIKRDLKELFENENAATLVPVESKKEIDSFIDGTFIYFDGLNYITTDINTLINITYLCSNLLAEFTFNRKRNLLQFMADNYI